METTNVHSWAVQMWHSMWNFYRVSYIDELHYSNFLCLDVASKSAKVKVHGKIGGIPIPFPVSPSEACGNWGIQCPIEVEKLYELKLSLPILTTYPKIKAVVKMELSDDQNKDFFCQQFPIRIQSA